MKAAPTDRPVPRSDRAGMLPSPPAAQAPTGLMAMNPASSRHLNSARTASSRATPALLPNLVEREIPQLPFQCTGHLTDFTVGCTELQFQLGIFLLQ